MQKKTLYVEFQLYIGQGERGLLMVNPTKMIFLRTFYLYLSYLFLPSNVTVYMHWYVLKQPNLFKKRLHLQ